MLNISVNNHIAVALICMFSLGCEEELGIRPEFDEPFTMYGMMSPDLDTQSVWLYPLAITPGLSAGDPQSIHFSSIDLESGEEHIWQDSLITAADGQNNLVFYTSFEQVRPEPNIAQLFVQVNGEEVQVIKPEISYEVIRVSLGPDGPSDVVTRAYHRQELQKTDAGWQLSFNVWEDRLFVVGVLRTEIRPFIQILKEVRESQKENTRNNE